MFILIGYKDYYGREASRNVAKELIGSISSRTLLNYVSFFNIHLYLNENSEDTGKVQRFLFESMARKFQQSSIEHFNHVVEGFVGKGQRPMFFYRLSNLTFYTLILETWNDLEPRELTSQETAAFFDCYLSVNSIVNSKIESNQVEIEKAIASGNGEDIMAIFAHQKDYESNSDFSNQISRGIEFFEYLQNHKDFSLHFSEYLAEKFVSGHLPLLKNVLTLFVECGIGEKQIKQSINLLPYVKTKQVNLKFIDTLCINNEISDYKEDESFGILRNKPLFKKREGEYLLLDVNFLIDQLYKSQVFAFNSFLKKKNITENFLSIKATEFTEGQYLKQVIDTCFPEYIRAYGKTCINSKGDELCDVYIRKDQSVLLIEFKDVTLNASAKNSAKTSNYYQAIDKKFVANEKGRPKGVTQLINAIRDIEDNGILFDTKLSLPIKTIFPVIVYTDNSFAVSGVNKRYRELFNSELAKLRINKIVVEHLTFVNLSSFEIWQDYFSCGEMDLFNLIHKFQTHVKIKEYDLTPFEVFCRFENEAQKIEVKGTSKWATRNFKQIEDASAL